MIIDRVTAVWDNLESAYAEYLGNGGDLTKAEYLKGITFVKDGKYVQSLLTSILGQEVANYTAEQHEDMQEILDITSRVAYVILENPDLIVDNLDDVVGNILSQSMQGGHNAIKNYTAQDAAIIKQLDYTSLKDAINAGFFSTTSYLDDDGKLRTIRVNNTTGALFHVANDNEAKVFCFLKEAGVYPDLPFYQKIHDDLNKHSYEGDVVFVDSSLYTAHGDVRRIYNKEVKVHEEDGRFLGEFNGTLASCTLVCFE